MHDVGKIGLPDNILLKPGPLSADERFAMQTHTTMGAAILQESSVELLQMARDIALCHHEWWNGEGYPRRLAGERIPECARIAAVADVYDALTHTRIYRAALPEEEVMAYMTAQRGTQFEPRVFDAFLKVLPLVRRLRKRTPHPVPGIAEAAAGGPEP
jgi:putative two-component system response regulator